MRADVRRSIGTVFAVVLVLVLSGCAAMIPPKYRKLAGVTDRGAQTTSIYRTTHCTEGNSLFACSSSTASIPSIPDVGSCGERAASQPLANLSSVASTCRVQMRMWIPTGRLLRHTEACAEPLLNFQLSDDPSRGIGSSARVARVLDHAAHPALTGGLGMVDSSGCELFSP